MKILWIKISFFILWLIARKNIIIPYKLFLARNDEFTFFIFWSKITCIRISRHTQVCKNMTCRVNSHGLFDGISNKDPFPNLWYFKNHSRFHNILNESFNKWMSTKKLDKCIFDNVIKIIIIKWLFIDIPNGVTRIIYLTLLFNSNRIMNSIWLSDYSF